MIDLENGKFSNYYIDYLGRIQDNFRQINGNQVLTQGSLLTNGFLDGSSGVSVSADGSMQINNNDPTSYTYGHHEDQYGNSYWGTSPELWKADINNAKAYILSNGNCRFVNGYFTGTMIASHIIGTSIDIPDTTSANSFHVNINGDTWWGCNNADYTANIENAKAGILSNGSSLFRNGMEIRTSSTINLIISDATRTNVAGMYISGADLIMETLVGNVSVVTPVGKSFNIDALGDNGATYIELMTDIFPPSDNIYSIGDFAFGLKNLFARTVNAGYLQPYDSTANMGDITERWNKIYAHSIDLFDTNGLVIGGNAYIPTTITYVTGINFVGQTFTTASKTVLAR